MRWVALLCVAAVAATPCSKERLKSLLVEQRHRSWVCENVRLKVIEDYPWEVWALDTAEAFEQLNFKVLVPHPVEDSEDLLWSLVERPYNQTLPDGSRRGPPVATARFWTNMHAPPGRAFAVEGMNRLSPVQEWLPKLYATLGIAGSVDLYCARVGRRPVNSYGWHTDTVDALIYVLNGTKRVRVAGHFPGSRVTLDKVISAGSVVYVPGGRFHSLRSMPADVDASRAELVVALSIGLPNPNEDLLEVRTNVMRKAFENQNFKWNDVIGQVAALPEDFPRKPEVVFAEKDDLDSHGFSALHRRTLQGDARRLAVLLHSGAEVNLRSLPSAQRPALTALGLAACCVAEEPALLLTAKLLEFSADPKAVEFHEDGRSYSALEVAARRSEAFAQKLRSRLEVAEEL